MDGKLKRQITAIVLVLCVAISLLIASPTKAAADRIFYTDGTSQEGVVILENEDEIWLEVTTGKTKAVVKISRENVSKIVKGETAAQRLAELYRKRLETKAPRSAKEWYEFGLWCEKYPELKHKAKSCYENSIIENPEYAPSHLKLGHVRYDGVWMDYDTMMLSKGYVKFRGEWVTVEAKMDIILAEQELARLRAEERLKKAEARLKEEERKLAESRNKPVQTRVYTQERVVYREPVYSPLWYGISSYGYSSYHRNRVVYPHYSYYPYRSKHGHRSSRHHSHHRSSVGVSYTKRSPHSTLRIGFIFR